MFNFNIGKETGIGDSYYDENDPLNGISYELTYQDCLNIYKYWPLGVRIVQSLPNFALSVNREITFDGFPKECVEHFENISKELNIKNIIKQHCYNIRIFGASCLFIQTDGEDYSKILDVKEISTTKHLRFIHATPLITAGSVIDINPLSKNYLQPINIKIQNQDVNLSRVIWSNNNDPQYLQWSVSAYNYAGRSSFANMTDIIKYWNRAVIALQRIATKAGGIIVKNRSEGSLLTSIVLNSTNKFLETIRNLSNDGIASIGHNDSIELFNLNGTSEVELIINKFNEILQLALTDTPTAILLDERLAKGFGNGEEDFKALLIAVESYRENTLNSIYERLDKIVMYRAFNNEFLDYLMQTYKNDFKNRDELFVKLCDSFSYEWESLYPESEASRIDNMGRKLDNLMKLKELGVTISDIENIINTDDTLFSQELTLEEPESEEDDSYVSTSEVSKPTGDDAQDD